MTITVQKLQLDKWLICSGTAFQSITSFWRFETAAGSLLDWRVNTKAIEHVSLAELPDRLDALANEGAWSAIVVVDRADKPLLERLQGHVNRLSIRLIEWSEAPLTAVLNMNAPDQAILSALQNSEANVGNLELATVPSDLSGFVAALSSWEAACKESDREGFADTLSAFANSPIPWNELLNPPSNPDTQMPAANDNWIEIVRLAAATSGDERKAVSLEDPRNKPAQWTLTLSPIDEGPSTLAVFQVNEDAIAAFVGCRIRLRVRGDVVDLGEIDHEGQAEMILPSRVEMQGLAISWDGDE